jgi:oxaloacetate decarboxylase gamma subunit
MPITDLILQGLQLMLLGMGVVFIFLMILVVALSLMSKIALYFDKEDELTSSENIKPAIKPGNTALVAVISAAVSRYRSIHN